MSQSKMRRDEELEMTLKSLYVMGGFMDRKEIDMNKPPIGITPRWLLDEERAIEIEQAITRYNEVDYPIPVEWIQELNEVYKRLNKFYHIQSKRLYYQAIRGLEKYE